METKAQEAEDFIDVFNSVISKEFTDIDSKMDTLSRRDELERAASNIMVKNIEESGKIAGVVKDSQGKILGV